MGQNCYEFEISLYYYNIWLTYLSVVKYWTDTFLVPDEEHAQIVCACYSQITKYGFPYLLIESFSKSAN